MEHELDVHSAVRPQPPFDQAIMGLFVLSGPPLCEAQNTLFIELDLVWCSRYGLPKRMYGMCS